AGQRTEPHEAQQGAAGGAGLGGGIGRVAKAETRQLRATDEAQFRHLAQDTQITFAELGHELAVGRGAPVASAHVSLTVAYVVSGRFWGWSRRPRGIRAPALHATDQATDQRISSSAACGRPARWGVGGRRAGGGARPLPRPASGRSAGVRLAVPARYYRAAVVGAAWRGLPDAPCPRHRGL